jgi:hypothetical protein
MFAFNPPAPLVATGLAAMMELAPNTVDVLHFRAQHATGYDCQGQVDYLSDDPGEFGTGINWVANTANPIKGAFCRPKRRLCQGKDGIYFETTAEFFTATDLGDVCKLFDDKPKLYDRFEILGQRYYATGPAHPCSNGNSVGLWKIPLILERVPVASA